MCSRDLQGCVVTFLELRIDSNLSLSIVCSSKWIVFCFFLLYVLFRLFAQIRRSRIFPMTKMLPTPCFLNQPTEESKSELRLSELTGCDLPERLACDGRLLVSWVGREVPKTPGLDRKFMFFFNKDLS